MAAYKALPERFSTVHPVYKTPSFSTLVMGVVAIVYYVGMTLISENKVISTSRGVVPIGSRQMP